MIDALLAIYSEPLFFWFPVASSLVGVAGFALFAAPLTLLARLDPPWLRARRIQTRRKRADDIVLPSLRYSLVNQGLTLLNVCLLWPLLRLSSVHAGPLPAWYVIAGQLVFFIYLDDFLYYWMHRAFHWGWLYRRFHIVHHRMPAPWAVAAHYMHPVEFAATTGLLLVGPLLVGAHVATLWIWVIFRQWEAAEGHCGYRLPLNPSYLLPGYGGNEFHDFHHAKFTGNYAGFFAIWDRVFKTLSPGYAAYRAARRAPAAVEA